MNAHETSIILYVPMEKNNPKAIIREQSCHPWISFIIIIDINLSQKKNTVLSLSNSLHFVFAPLKNTLNSLLDARVCT